MISRISSARSFMFQLLRVKVLRSKILRFGGAAAAAGIKKERDAEGDDRRGQQHAHGRAAEQEAQLRIGLAEKFAKNARQPIKGGEKPRRQARTAESAESHGDG